MRQIIALGGGGFSEEPENPLLDLYILAQAGKPRPKVCFLPTASGDALQYVVNFYAAFTRLNCQPSHLMLINPTMADIESFILDQDVIYVGGGNTRSMLALWREWGLPSILSLALDKGIVLAGISAGAICWFEQGLTDSVTGRLSVLPCLGFLPGSCSPHIDVEAERRPAFHRLLSNGEIAPGFGIENSAALHFIDGRLAHVISSRPTATAYQLKLAGDQVAESALEARYLGK